MKSGRRRTYPDTSVAAKDKREEVKATYGSNVRTQPSHYFRPNTIEARWSGPAGDK